MKWYVRYDHKAWKIILIFIIHPLNKNLNSVTVLVFFSGDIQINAQRYTECIVYYHPDDLTEIDLVNMHTGSITPFQYTKLTLSHKQPIIQYSYCTISFGFAIYKVYFIASLRPLPLHSLNSLFRTVTGIVVFHHCSVIYSSNPICFH